MTQELVCHDCCNSIEPYALDRSGELDYATGDGRDYCASCKLERQFLDPDAIDWDEVARVNYELNCYVAGVVP